MKTTGQFSTHSINVSTSTMNHPSYRNLPVSLFGSVMGIAGLGLAYRLSSMAFGFPLFLAHALSGIAWSIFLILVFFYVLKWIKYPGVVREELKHPVMGNFFGTIPISMLLLSAIARPYLQLTSEIVWLLGTILMMIVAGVVVFRLIHIKQELGNVTPAWLIPGVGALDIAVTGTNISIIGSKELVLLGFAIGAILGIAFFSMILARLIVYQPLPERITPSLFILIAPFAVGFLAYVGISQTVDTFATSLYLFTLFLFIIISAKVFFSKTRFMITWWAISFPIAALSNSAIKFSILRGDKMYSWIAITILIVVSIAIGFLFLKSLSRLVNRKLFTT